MKNSLWYALFFTIGIGNVLYVNAMETLHKEAPEIRYGECSFEQISKEEINSKSEVLLVRAGFNVINEVHKNNFDYIAFPPKFLRVKSFHSSDKTAEILAKIKMRYEPGEYTNCKGIEHVSPGVVIVDMTEYDDEVVKSYVNSDEDEKMAFLGRAVPAIQQLNNLKHAKDNKGAYLRGLLHGGLGVSFLGATGFATYYGAWWYFNRNK